MAVEKLFIGSNVFDGSDFLAGFPVEDTVNEQHGITMGQQLADLMNIQGVHFSVSVKAFTVFSNSRILSRIVPNLRTSTAVFSHS